MDRDTIRRMDPELYQEKLEEAVMDDVSCILNVNKGHSSVLHAGQSIDDMAMRVVKEGKQAVSSFYNAESLIENLQDAVYFEAENITNWITSDRIDFKKPIDYQQIVFHMNMANEAIGQGVSNDGRLMETSEMTIVLQRDLSNESPFGFFVKTAYADIENEKAVQIGTVDFAKTIQESQDFDSSIQKAYFALRNKYPEENIQLKSQNGHEFIQIMKNSDDGKLIAFIDESGTSIKQYGDKECKKLTLGDCFLHNREIVNMSTVAENTIREPLQTITKKKDIQR